MDDEREAIPSPSGFGMISRRISQIRLWAVAIFAGVVTVMPETDAPAKAANVLLAGHVAGAPVQCINVGLTNESNIIDGEAIVYRVGRTLFVNKPLNAKALDRDDLLVTTTTISTQLCRNELASLIDRAGRFQKSFVTLGDFTPYTLPPRER